MIDRASEAIKPHYEAIRDKARASRVNHLDETPWHNGGKLNWLWVMANTAVAFFMIHTNRSKEAFESLIGMWSGIMGVLSATMHETVRPAGVESAVTHT